jgi:hypothetical protein
MTIFTLWSSKFWHCVVVSIDVSTYVTTQCHDTEDIRITSFHSSQGPIFAVSRSETKHIYTN